MLVNKLKFAIALTCTLLMLRSTSLNAQSIIDSISDFEFGDIQASALMELKKSFDEKDSAILNLSLLHSGFLSRKDTCHTYYINQKLNLSLEYCSSPIHMQQFQMLNNYRRREIMIMRGGASNFKEVLREFIRQQKWNENLNVDEMNNEVAFLDQNMEMIFFICLSDSDPCLIFL